MLVEKSVWMKFNVINVFYYIEIKVGRNDRGNLY